MTAEHDVAAYFDANTASFAKTGQGAASIRRAIWTADVRTRDDAFHVIDRRILEHLRQMAAPSRVVDLGCGVGSSLLWLRERLEFEGIGVTISAAQARLAREAFALVDGLSVCHTSFTSLPPSLLDIHFAFAIEAFVLSVSPAAFFSAIAPRLATGARLLVADDFLGPRSNDFPKLIEDFRYGWVANSLVSVADASASAQQFGLELVENEDFTAFLELGRPRDKLLNVVVALGKPFKPKSWLFRSWVGGTALQRSLKKRAIEHRLLTFVKK